MIMTSRGTLTLYRAGDSPNRAVRSWSASEVALVCGAFAAGQLLDERHDGVHVGLLGPANALVGQ